MSRVHSPKHPLSGRDVLDFLRTFEGAAASFGPEEGPWSLWLPELAADEHPLTPASQVYFPVILRHGEQAFAIRFFYDCSTGRMRYYTSAIPEEIARLPELENAISELFRHSLPIEPVRQRSLRRPSRIGGALRITPPRAKPVTEASLAEPVEGEDPVPSLPPVEVPPAAAEAAAAEESAPVEEPVQSEELPSTALEVINPPPRAAEAVPATLVAASLPPEVSVASDSPREVTRTIRFEVGPAARSVLLAFVLTLGFLVLAGIAAYTYLRATEDPGVLHHRLQLEEMRQRTGY